jgi:hypothetical protein
LTSLSGTTRNSSSSCQLIVSFGSTMYTKLINRVQLVSPLCYDDHCAHPGRLLNWEPKTELMYRHTLLEEPGGSTRSHLSSLWSSQSYCKLALYYHYGQADHQCWRSYRMREPESHGGISRRLSQGVDEQDQTIRHPSRTSFQYLWCLPVSLTFKFACNVAIQLVLFSTIVVGLFRKPNGPLEGAGNFFVKFLK